MTIENVTRRFDGVGNDKIEQQVQYCLRNYENDLLEEKLIALVEGWFFNGLFFNEGIDIPDGVTVNPRLDAEGIDKIEQQVQYCLRNYENDLREEKLIALAEGWFFNGSSMYDVMDVGDGLSVKRRLEVQIIDKIEQQVQYCLRSYKNDLLEDKLIDLVQEWFFNGYFGGAEHAQLKQKQKQKG